MENLPKEEQTKTEITIGGNRVVISCFISSKDIKLFQESRKLKSSDFVLSILSNHIDEKFKSKIDTISSEDIKKFIDAYVESDPTLKYYYKNNTSKNINDRFVEALELSYDDSISKVREKSKPFLESTAQTIDSVKALYNSLGLEKIREVIQNYLKSCSDFKEWVTKLESNFSDLYKRIKIPSITKEWIKELQYSYEAWGEYGWTLPPNMPVNNDKLNVFNRKPKSLKDANDIMRKYTNKAPMNMLFDELRESKIINKYYLEEAIENFEAKKYLSCTMIIFSLIDKIIICSQNKKENRKTGLGGIKKISKKMEPDVENQKIFYFQLAFFNVKSALMTFFANGNNFKEQPKVINRNFLYHGMYNSKVRRRDAAQLFLLLNNCLILNDLFN